jgi:hypothetical protein
MRMPDELAGLHLAFEDPKRQYSLRSSRTLALAPLPPLIGRGCPATRNFSCLAKKSHQKKATLLTSKPRLHARFSGDERTRCAQTPFVGLRQPENHAHNRLRQKGEKRRAPPGFDPFCRCRELLTGLGKPKASKRCLSAASSFAARTSQKFSGFHRKQGCAFFGYFLCTSKESNVPPGTPGQSVSTVETPPPHPTLLCPQGCSRGERV